MENAMVIEYDYGETSANRSQKSIVQIERDIFTKHHELIEHKLAEAKRYKRLHESSVLDYVFSRIVEKIVSALREYYEGTANIAVNPDDAYDEVTEYILETVMHDQLGQDPDSHDEPQIELETFVMGEIALVRYTSTDRGGAQKKIEEFNAGIQKRMIDFVTKNVADGVIIVGEVDNRFSIAVNTLFSEQIRAMYKINVAEREQSDARQVCSERPNKASNYHHGE